ncbi:carbohydrate kinase family protein [Leptolyngbya sp. AN02str]|uniref:carbohydrate kinase family protein n=1 Tax=Leptolyngbya sp. AN02str TaxID=3423363 RepID=UPI003D30EF38
MTKPRVLCFGEVLYDYLADQPGRPYEQVVSWTAYPGGAPANVACALTKLGTPAGFVGCVGQDEPGNDLVQLLQDTGVDVSGVQRHATAPTRAIYVVRAEDGDRQFAGFGDRTSDEFADTRLQAAHIPAELFVQADYLVLGTLEMPYPETNAAIQRALELAEMHYVKLVLDVNWRPMFWPDEQAAWQQIHSLIKRVDFLKLSAEEADWLFETRDPGVIAHRLESIEGVLVTDGDKGCAYAFSGYEGKAAAFPVDVEDTTGAGDAFVAGFLHQLCQLGIPALQDPETVRSVMSYANAVGALTTIRAGAIAAQPSPAEVDAFLYINQR